jgi:nucleoside-diphosphate kinase
MEKTFAIIKPDAVGNGHIGKVLSRIEAEGFRIVAMRMLHLTRGEAEGFYAVHRERPFFDSLTAYMSSGPVVTLALERDDAIPHWRKTMGATDPGKAEAGTIRKQIGESIERNAVHGSDAPETAAIEIAYFFRGVDQLSNR